VSARKGLVCLLACLVAGGVAIAAGDADASAGPVLRDADGLHILSQRQLDPRLIELSVKTSALPDPAGIRILLPSDYARHPHRRYPVFYLLDGTSGHASDWTTMGGAEQTTAGRELIVVMPDITLNGDGGGWCTNWPDGAERWETFHIGQLIPFIDRNLRTRAGRNGRAIAGLSQGGFCSMSYAARHPDLFATALAYSGAPDIYYDADARAGASLIINATEFGLTRVAPDTFFGNPVSDGINWAAHDPTTLAPNLRHTRLYMYFGNGFPGPYDSGAPSPEAMGIEGAVWRDNIDFHNRLDALGIPSLYDPYGNGTHAWPYWARDLRWSIGPLMRDFAHPLPVPRTITFESADDAFSVFGWTVQMHRSVREFATLQDAGRGGFTLAGSGSGTVTTPPSFIAGRPYAIVLQPTGARRALLVRRAGRNRRLRFDVPLGPSNPYQQDTAQAQAAGTHVYLTHVTIRALP